MATGPFYDTMPGPLRRDTLNEMWEVWQDAILNIKGDQGWSPLLRAVQDGVRSVIELYDWVGGEGIKPTETGYLGSTGYVSDISLATDFRGLKGDAATIAVGTVTTGAPGTPVVVTNSGTSSAATFNFTIPKGADGVLTDVPNDSNTYARRNGAWQSMADYLVSGVVGGGANQIPTNQHLGNMAFQSAEGFVITPAASATPHQIGSMVFQLTDDTTLVVKVKGSDGVVRSTTLTLA